MRKFLAPKKMSIKIFMIDELIEPYDPLFLTYNRKKDEHRNSNICYLGTSQL